MPSRIDWPKKPKETSALLLLDALVAACYDARNMIGQESHVANFFFYFYFGDNTQPLLQGLGDSATACKE